MYRKFSANRLFTGYEWLDDTWVLVTDDHGIVSDIVLRTEAGEDILQLNGVLCPGFVNSHCHLELSHLKGMVPRSTGLVDFVYHILQHRAAAAELVAEAIADAEAEMLDGGIVAVGDICNTAFSIPQKLKRRMYYHSFVEVSGFVPAGALARFNSAMEVFDQFKESGLPCSIVPHAPYSVSGKLFDLIAGVQHNDIQSMHNQEAAAENEFFINKKGEFLELYRKLNIDIDFFEPTGKNSLPSVLHHFRNFRRLLLVHDVCSSDEDIQLALEYFAAHPDLLFFCICVNANQYISNTLPKLDRFFSKDCNMVIGTDSLASNGSLSMMAEINSLLKNYSWLTLEDCLPWATSNGARALGIGDKYGSFTKGRQPGVLQLTDDGVRRLL